MKRDRFDVVVAGLGAAGSAAALFLARRGVRVLGLDPHHPPHELGSSHGRTRIFREAYFEHPLYVPLVRRALELWSALERDAARPLLHRTGALSVGPESGSLIRGTLTSAIEHDIPHELLDAAAVRRRFEGWTPPAEHVAVLEPGAGFLLPERAVEAMLDAAARAGAVLRFGRSLRSWRVVGDRVDVEASEGRVEAGRLVLAVGPWLGDLLREPALPLTVERQQVHWFAPREPTDVFRAERAPILLWEHEPGARMLYTIPDTGDGLKAAFHHGGAVVHPDAVDRTIDAAEAEAVGSTVGRILPAAAGALRSASVCLYTNAPDDHFVIGDHPSGALVVSACSGHGFKFVPAVGEIVADLVVSDRSGFDLSPFRPARFRAVSP